MHRGGEGTGQVPGSARRRWPVTVAIVGADGSGKTSVAQALLESGRWFDMKLAKIGGAEPLVSHWSRLIDAPLALDTPTIQRRERGTIRSTATMASSVAPRMNSGSRAW